MFARNAGRAAVVGAVAGIVAVTGLGGGGAKHVTRSPLAGELALSRGSVNSSTAIGSPRAGTALGANGISTRVSATATTVHVPGGSVAFGALTAAAPHAAGNVATLTGDGITETWTNGPAGLEQVIGLARRPASERGRLSLRVPLKTSLAARDTAGAVTFVQGTRAVLSYGALHVTDASGATVPATMSVSGRAIEISVADARATYPLTIDPLVVAGTLTASGGTASDQFGTSIALSGNTAVVGADNAPGGAGAGQAYVFQTQSGDWSHATQVATLNEPGTSTAGDLFGFSVAISGATIVVGAPNAAAGVGAAFVFSQPAGGWSSAAPVVALSGSGVGANSQFGFAVATTGSTVLASAPGNGTDTGAVYSYSEPSAGWASETTQAQTATLTNPSGAGVLSAVGYSLAVQGSVLVVGAPGLNSFIGASAVYTASSGSWAGVTPATLSVSGGYGGEGVGHAVAIDGSTIAVGAPNYDPTGSAGNDSQVGAVYAYSEPSSGWATATQSAMLTGSDGAAGDSLGTAVAVNAGRIWAGAPDTASNALAGKLYEFDQPSGGWANATETTQPANPAAHTDDTIGDALAAGPSVLLAGASGALSSAGDVVAFAQPAPPAIVTQPQSQALVAGTSATFTAAATPTTSTVQWQLSTDGGSTWMAIAGATTGTLSIAATAALDGNQYEAVFTDGAGSTTTTAAKLTVLYAPQLTAQPASVTVAAGASATFTAKAGGDPVPTVQWEASTNGTTWTAIGGATSTTLSVTATAALDGTQYEAVFTNSQGAVTSSPAKLTVLYAPQLTTQPTSATVAAGASATFTVAAAGNPAPTVQWKSSTNGTTWTAVSGATSTTLNVAATAALDGTEYEAVLTNSQGSATSTTATLTVQYAPQVTTQPASITVASGATATLSAAAIGDPTPTVQWQTSTDGGSTWTAVSGATQSTLAVSVAAQYRAVFSNSVGAATTQAATLTVTVPTTVAPQITTQPVSATVAAGASATFTAAASGTPTPTVQWQTSTDGGTTWAAVSGATQTTLTVSVAAQYRAVFSNSAGSATTQAATLTVSTGGGLLPVVRSVSPNRGGPLAIVVIHGSNFAGVSAVTFGTQRALFFLPLGTTAIIALAPSGHAGSTVDVQVTTRNGKSAISSGDRFTF